jgi:DNA-binding response OmpR family regulator
MPKILLVEDDKTLGYVLQAYLEMKEFQVSLACDGKQGLALFKKYPFDLCILDVMMPEMDGFTLGAEIRRLEPGMPLLFLTARSLKVDKLRGFHLGADDYLVKPVDEEELTARIHAVLRRSRHSEQTEAEYLAIGAYRFDARNQKLIFGGEEQLLTEREAQLLRLLCEHRGRLLPRQLVLKMLWNQSDYFTRRSMDVFISRLRKYLSGDAAIHIENVYGSGFILRIGAEGDGVVTPP